MRVLRRRPGRAQRPTARPHRSVQRRPQMRTGDAVCTRHEGIARRYNKVSERKISFVYMQRRRLKIREFQLDASIGSSIRLRTSGHDARRPSRREAQRRCGRERGDRSGVRGRRSPGWTSCCTGRNGRLFGDQAYWSEDHRQHCGHAGIAFHVVKNLWGFTKVRYRGLYKNTVRALTLFALSNLYYGATTVDGRTGEVREMSGKYRW